MKSSLHPLRDEIELFEEIQTLTHIVDQMKFDEGPSHTIDIINRSVTRLLNLQKELHK